MQALRAAGAPVGKDGHDDDFFGPAAILVAHDVRLAGFETGRAFDVQGFVAVDLSQQFRGHEVHGSHAVREQLVRAAVPGVFLAQRDEAYHGTGEGQAHVLHHVGAGTKLFGGEHDFADGRIQILRAVVQGETVFRDVDARLEVLVLQDMTPLKAVSGLQEPLQVERTVAKLEPLDVRRSVFTSDGVVAQHPVRDVQLADVLFPDGFTGKGE